ncbi:ABC transporter permease [Streptobacillus felis]|uniref:ABC transporter permease n=1 Tax=Streptobacillus felis TaxID=1384509 RepID=UPI000835760B|nr:ABC transporter permease [Streptobacillus felis]
MNSLLIFLGLLPESIKFGLIYSIMVMGVYITYKILDFPDLTVDGSFTLGGFTFAATMLIFPNHPIIGLLVAAISGTLAGLVTGLLHVRYGINKLLSGIITMTALYSINARVLNKPNVFLENEQSWFFIISYEKYFSIFTVIAIVLLIIKFLYDRRIKPDKYVYKSLLIYILIYVFSIAYIYYTKDITMYLLLLIVFVVKLIMDYILTSKFGLILRALGDNEILVSNLGVSVDKVKIMGLMLSNLLVASSGALFAQYIKVVDLSSSVGTIIIGLASIIFGMGIIKRTRSINNISIVILGSIIYYIIINFALNSSSITDEIFYALGFNSDIIQKLSVKPTDVKIITALFLAVILGLGKKRGKSNA